MGNGITISKKQLPGVPQAPGARKIVVIPYQKWIYFDARRFGHFNQFSTDQGCDSLSSNSAALAALPTFSSSAFTTPTSFVSTSLSLTNDFIAQTRTQLTSTSAPSPVAFLTNKSNLRGGGGSNNPSAFALVGSAMTLSSSSSTVTCTSATPSGDSDARRLNPKPVYYVNGRFFKSLTRLGDAQFILSEHGEDDIVLTVPSNIERYRTNDNTVRERVHRLNRVIACCDEFIVFQLWKGNNEVRARISPDAVFSYSKRSLPGGDLRLRSARSRAIVGRQSALAQMHLPAPTLPAAEVVAGQRRARARIDLSCKYAQPTQHLNASRRPERLPHR